MGAVKETGGKSLDEIKISAHDLLDYYEENKNKGNSKEADAAAVILIHFFFGEIIEEIARDKTNLFTVPEECE